MDAALSLCGAFASRNAGWEQRSIFLNLLVPKLPAPEELDLAISAIERGGLVDVLEHPNQERYSGQMIYVVNMEGYLHLVPFVTDADGTKFLKTIIPSRKATRDIGRRRSP